MRKHHGGFERSRKRNARADRWGAAMAGGILFALPMAGGLYRGSLGWIDAVVAIVGVAALAVAADSFARRNRRPEASSEVSCAPPGTSSGCPRVGR
jgi:hypothetical protein